MRQVPITSDIAGFDHDEKKGALHLVSAVNHDNARLLAQEAVEDKSNEIPAVRRLIERFPHLDGATVTDPESIGLYSASQVYVVEREVITSSPSALSLTRFPLSSPVIVHRFNDTRHPAPKNAHPCRSSRV
jgi:hypothetical protein